jgi:hypothetical protein
MLLSAWVLRSSLHRTYPVTIVVSVDQPVCCYVMEKFAVGSADSPIEGGFSLVPSRMQIRYTRKSQGDLVWEFLALCSESKAEKRSGYLRLTQITTLMDG